MASPFAHTTRSLEADGGRPAFLTAAAALPLLAGWLAWGAQARTPVYAVSSSARLEIEGSAVPVDVVERGRVLESRLVLGRHVKAGDALLELDSTLERARLDELKVRREWVEKGLEPLRKQRDALASLLEAQRKVGNAAFNVAAARSSAARREAERAEALAAISRRAAAEGVGSKVSELEASLAAQRGVDRAQEGAAEVSHVAMSQALEGQRLMLQDAELTRKVFDAQSELANLGAQIQTTEAQIERRTVRAVADGYLGDIAPVTVGMTVSPGQSLGMIIPDRSLRMVAYFTPTEAVGRVSVGQPARLRFHAFPWTQFGMPEGAVKSVGMEPRAEGRQGGVRVEIEIARATATRIPLQHGLPATVEVLIDQATPWGMLLRAVGGNADTRVAPGEGEAGARDGKGP